MEVPNRVTLRNVWMEVNGTVEGAQDIAVEDGGELYIWSYAHSAEMPQGVIRVENLTVRAGGELQCLTVDEGVPRFKLEAVRVTVNGYGYFRTNDIHIAAHNLSVDLSGE